MGKFLDEFNKTKNDGEKKIGQYLLSRDDLKDKLDNPKKSLSECFMYCASQFFKNAKSIGSKCKYNGDEDSVIYGHAVHYYDEDDLKVDLSIFKDVEVKTKVTKDKEVKKDVPKKKKEPKKDVLDGQLSLF